MPCCGNTDSPGNTDSSSSCTGTSSRRTSTSNSSGISRRSWRPICLTTILRRLPGIPDYARQHTFLLYPLVYVVCTTPLAAGRLVSMSGHQVSLGYLCFAGAMIACNGWLDVLLYSSTRRSIIFSCEGPPSQNTGIETFSFMCSTPKLGNTTIVIGGVGPSSKPTRCNKWSENKACKGSKLDGLKTLKSECCESNDSLKESGMGEGLVMGMTIQCETVTTVSVEVNTTPPPPTRPNFAAIGRKVNETSTLKVERALPPSRVIRD